MTVLTRNRLFTEFTKKFEQLKAWLQREPLILDWIQIEVTSYCNANCMYCPRTVYKDNWSNRHLDLDTFRKIEPFLENTCLVYLQGWGEPFLCPSLFDMIKIAKDKGATVGLTTNGVSIDTELVRKVIDVELDLIALSLTGDEKSNDTIRRNTSYQKVLSVIDEFSRQKKLLKRTKPVINIAYLLFEKDLSGVYQLIDRIDGLGVSNIVISGLDFMACRSLLHHKVHYSISESEALQQIKTYAEQKGIQLITNLLMSEVPRKVCIENVTKSLYISADGSVSPCVYMNLPVGDGAINYCAEELTPYKRFTFGSVKEKPLLDLWFSKEYAKFRRGFLEGNHTEICKRCPKLYISEL